MSLLQESLKSSLDYPSYRQLIDDLLVEGKSTGPVQSEEITAYSKMNVQRMKKWDKILQLDSELERLIQSTDRRMIWLVITEGWCGDAAQIIPALVKMANLSEHIEIRFVLRDEHPDLMDKYLTNSARAIPILIALDAESNEETFVWGPRPAPAQELLLQLKAEGKPYAEPLHKWYALNKQITIQEEFKTIFNSLMEGVETE
ncbi:MAG: thioredoxin family protein [Cyclobacteriaceae bacterium]